MKHRQGFETRALHAGYRGDSATGSCGVPIYRTAAYHFRDTEEAARRFNLEEPGNIYTRITNPTQEIMEKRLADLEGGTGAVALASGTNAVFYAIINLCRAGDEILASRSLYGGTYTLFHDILPDFGITVRFFDPAEPSDLKDLFTERTKGIFTETIGNPTLDVADLEKLADTAHSRHVPLLVDNTFATPYLCRPIEHGADIVIHSLTKWINGHGTGIGGIVVDAGRFDWFAGDFPSLTEPDPSYHGIRYADPANGPAPFALRLRLVPLRNMGGCMAPDNAWLTLQGVETLALRMERHCENGARVAAFLKEQRGVEWVRYPGLPDDPAYPVAARYFGSPDGSFSGFGGMVVFGIKGGLRAGSAFINNLSLFSHLANVGDAKSLAIHPASTTHAQLDSGALEKSGISDNLIRLSIGIESYRDIEHDLSRGLAAAGGRED